MEGKGIPLRLVETWFWMAFKCKRGDIKEMGVARLKEYFGNVELAVKKFPEFL